MFGLQFRFIGTGWLVVSEEGLDLSPIWLGIVGLASALPTIAFAVPAGIVADRYEHRTILWWTQGLTAVLSFLLALGIVQGLVNVWVLIAWAITVGCLTALAVPTQDAILPRLIDTRSMPSAVALTSSVWNTMRIVGPATAGLLIAWIGIGQAFFVTAVGGLPASALAEWIGAPWTVALGALSVTCFAALVLALVRELRHLPAIGSTPTEACSP